MVDWGNGDKTSLTHTGAKDTLYHTYKKGVCSGVIKITATNVCGSSFTTWNPIDISEKDKALWTVNTTCNPNSDHVFNNLSSDLYCLSPDIKSYFWDFGDGATLSSSNPVSTHTYSLDNTYLVQLTVTDVNGNVNTAQAVVTVAFDFTTTGDNDLDGLNNAINTDTITGLLGSIISVMSSIIVFLHYRLEKKIREHILYHKNAEILNTSIHS